jgi:eukaryotic-like serine/threonine-protein kinase
LGDSLRCQKRYDEAEPLLLKGYEGLKTREQKLSVKGSECLRDATLRLVRYYEATNRPDRARDWAAVVPDETAPFPRI